MRCDAHRKTALAVLAIGALVLWTTVACAEGGSGAGSSIPAAHEAMIRAIEADMQATARATGRDRLAPRVLEALRSVPRHQFVPEALEEVAYENRPLPIGEGQTISQPFVVALMTDLLELRPDARVLEIGTGSGYQAAVLAELVERVYTIEIVPELGRRARATFRRLGISNVEVRIGDGFVGWPGAAPFDGIILTAAIGEVPPPLVDQLAPGGRLVLPEGDPRGSQVLVVISRDEDGELHRRRTLPVRFVPFTGEGVRRAGGG